MSGFSYYMPGYPVGIQWAKQIDDQTGLYAVLGDRVLKSGPHPNGPDGGQGIVFAIEGGDTSVDRDKQTWLTVRNDKGEVTHWIGWNKANPPGPDDLQRPQLVDGFPTKLEDGKDWIVPCLHASFTTLPQRVRYDGNQFNFEVVQGYEDLCADVAKYRELQIRAETESVILQPQEVFRLFARALGVNYHVGPIECAVGNSLFSSRKEITQGMWSAIFGYRAIMDEEAAQKKTPTAPVG